MGKEKEREDGNCLSGGRRSCRPHCPFASASGGRCHGERRHGGGAFSGQDPTKVDRSAAYMARYIAKNIVANGFARKCEIQLSYAIGIAKPISIYVDTFGTGKIPDIDIAKKIMDTFKLTPRGIINYLEFINFFFNS